jgi:8-oxo-dGTP pyrophosphatase MutT (NUDIX family)
MAEEKRFRVYVAAFLVLEKDGRILLHQRANSGYQDGKWGLVSGHMEGAETARHCAAREAKEEAGIDIDPDDLEVVHIMHRYRPEREYIDIYVLTDKWLGKAENREPENCGALDWFDMDKLPENMVPSVKSALESILQGDFYSEFWHDTAE